MDQLTAIMGMMARSMIDTSEQNRRQQEQRDDQKFKVDIVAPKIDANNLVGLLSQLNVFDRTMRKASIRTCRTLWRYFESSLSAWYKKALEHEVRTDPLKSFLDYAEMVGATDDTAWARVIRCARLIVIKRCGGKYEEIPKLVRDAWERLRMPEVVTPVGVVDWLDQMKDLLFLCFDVGVFQQIVACRIQILKDLNDKVPTGTSLKRYLAWKDWKPTTIAQWEGMVMEWREHEKGFNEHKITMLALPARIGLTKMEEDLAMVLAPSGEEE